MRRLQNKNRREHLVCSRRLSGSELVSELQIQEEAVRVAWHGERHHMHLGAIAREVLVVGKLAVVVLDSLRVEGYAQILVDQPLDAQVVAREVQRILVDARVGLEPLQQAERRERGVRDVVMT